MCFQVEKMVPQITRINDLNLIIFLSSCPNKKELDIGVNSLIICLQNNQSVVLEP